MEQWQKAWSVGFAPQFSIKQLEVLKTALVQDDPQLLQGATTSPPPLVCVMDWPVEGACPISYMGWKGEDLSIVGDVEVFFGQACHEADQLLGEPAACRRFLNFVDDTPRDIMRRQLLEEVNKSIATKHGPLHKCGKCHHLYGESESHECPSQEYLKARNALISAAARASEIFNQDELEQACWERESNHEAQ